MVILWLLILWLMNIIVNGAPAIGNRRDMAESRFMVARHPFSGKLYYTDLTKIKNPTPIRRLRIMLTGKTQVAGSQTILTAYHFRVRWTPPEHWFDNFNPTNRKYNLICIGENVNTMHVQEFVNLKIDGQISGYEENFLIKDAVHLMIRCRIRAQNSSGLLSKWFPSERLFLHARWMENK